MLPFLSCQHCLKSSRQVPLTSRLSPHLRYIKEGSFRRNYSVRRTEAPTPSDYDILVGGRTSGRIPLLRGWSLYGALDAIFQIEECGSRYRSRVRVEQLRQSLAMSQLSELEATARRLKKEENIFTEIPLMTPLVPSIEIPSSLLRHNTNSGYMIVRSGKQH